MDNKAKIYTLYLVLEDLIISIDNRINNRPDFRENIDSNELFNKFLNQAKKQYSDLRYDLVGEILLANYKAEQEFGRLASRIKTFLGEIENGNNFPLVFTLWMVLDIALSFYASIGGTQLDWFYELEKPLNLGYQKYLSASQSNSEEWQQIDSIVKLKLGNF